ncbi:MAG: hypothetical protein IPN67_03600 [Bacteroidales bacterium]|nr:hypothetical protein [Bacteroidales bacterium]MBK8881480.1 hypothetical protein [Bacteroidales bacterium]
MKNIALLVVLMIPLMAGKVTDYQSSIQEKVTSQTKVQDSIQDLTAAQKNTNIVSQKEATAEEWKKFNKSDFEIRIMSNEERISELNERIRKPAEIFDSFYMKKIANLEKENRFLKGRLEAYEKHQTEIGSL